MTKPSAPLPDDVWVSYDPDNQYASNELCLYGPHKSLPSVRFVRASPQVPPRDKPTIDEIIESLRLLAGEAADELERLSSDNSVLALENEQLRSAAPPRAAPACPDCGAKEGDEHFRDCPRLARDPPRAADAFMEEHLDTLPEAAIEAARTNTLLQPAFQPRAAGADDLQPKGE